MFTQEEFELLLEEAFIAGYQDANTDIANESEEYVSPYEDLYAFDEARNDTSRDKVQKDAIRGAVKYFDSGLVPRDQVSNLTKTLVGVRSKNKKVQARAISKFKDKMEKDNTYAINLGLNTDGLVKGAARGVADGIKERTNNWKNHKFQLGKNHPGTQQARSELRDYKKAAGQVPDEITKKFGRAAYKLAVKPKFDNESIKDNYNQWKTLFNKQKYT